MVVDYTSVEFAVVYWVSAVIITYLVAQITVKALEKK